MIATGNASEIRTHDGAGLALSPPDLPAVIIYTMYKKRYTFLYLERKFDLLCHQLLSWALLNIETVNTEVKINDHACEC